MDVLWLVSGGGKEALPTLSRREVRIAAGFKPMTIPEPTTHTRTDILTCVAV